MECREIRLLLSEYVDGELSVEHQTLVAEHLVSCNRCAAELVELKAVTGVLFSVSEIDPPAEMLQKIEALTVDRKSSAPRIRIPSLAMPRFVGWAAAVIAVLGIIGSTVSRDSRQVVEPQIARSTAPGIRIEAHPAVTVPADRGLVVKASTKATTVASRKSSRIAARRIYRRHGTPAVTISYGHVAAQLAARPKAQVKDADQDSFDAALQESAPMDITPGTPTRESSDRMVVASGLTTVNSKAEEAALAELRTSISAKNRQRRAGSNAIGDSYDLGIASIKF